MVVGGFRGLFGFVFFFFVCFGFFCFFFCLGFFFVCVFSGLQRLSVSVCSQEKKKLSQVWEKS